MATLELKDIAKRFSRTAWGVKNISLSVEDREFVVLLGPSGCGKTTTLRLIAGLEDISHGSILLDGKDITMLPPRKRNVSMVFQHYAVWPHMTVFENIAFALRLRKTPDYDIESTVNETAALTKIEPFLDRYPHELSGGQQQRVALARALAVRPRLFLMDEPFSNLDASLRVDMRTELKAIHQQAGATTVFVTHDQAEAMSMADRIVIIRDGEIVQSGTPEDVYFRPANVFVAGFIGTPPMNFFEVEPTASGDALNIACPHFNSTLTAENRKALAAYTGKKLVMGIRPENMRLAEPDKALLTAKALVVEPQGAYQVISLQLRDQTAKTVVPPLLRITPGQTVSITFEEEHLHFFDADTGTRIQ
jgi:multiple sugar transport system ATP-binding protein